MLRPQPVLLPCQQLHCVREERAAAESWRASEQQPERAGERESERTGEGARRRPRLRSARLPATLPQRRAPCAPSRHHRYRWGPAGCRRRQGSGRDRGPRPAIGASPYSREARNPWGAPIALQRPPTELRGQEGGEAPGRPEGRAPRLLWGSPNPEERIERARPPSHIGPCAHPPCTPLLHKLFRALALGGRGELWAALWAPAPTDPSLADLLPLVVSVATSPGRARHGTSGKSGNPRLLSEASCAPRGSRAG